MSTNDLITPYSDEGVPITSTVGVEDILTATLVVANVEGLPFPPLLTPKHAGNTDYVAMKEIHQLLTENTALVKSNLGIGQNLYLRFILPPEKYTHITNTPFALRPNPGKTATVLE